MVKFKFELSDIDAENLFGCINSEIDNCLETILKAKFKGFTSSDYNWYTSRIEYLQHLKTKLTNSRV
jgi:hypothetical protein